MSKTTIVAARTPDADVDKRTISGLVLPYGRAGYTSAGPVTVNAGAVTLPDDISRVKLLRDHSDQPGFTPVGHAVAVEDTPDGIRMSFRIGKTSDGDVALADVTEHIRDALSVELVDTAVDGTGALTAGTLTAVALVPIPAFDDARVDLITAARVDEDTTATDEDDEDQDEDTTDEPDETDSPATTDPAVDTDVDSDTTNRKDTTDMTTPAVVPSGLTVKESAPLTASQAINAIGDMLARRNTPALTAAMEDIKHSANPATRAPAWLGELWDGAEYQREIIPTMTQKELTGIEAVGWRWKKKPEVYDYKGDKTEVPSGKAETEEVRMKANRLASAHDIDRAYFDFNETGFLASFLSARVEDYALKTDERAAKFLVESATKDATTKPKAEPDLLHAAARARQIIKTQVRIEPSAWLVNPNDMFGLFNITMLDIPQYLELLGVDPSKFVATDLVPAGAIVSYAKPAARWYELPGAPIRVDAEHISHGGIDSGVFGYWAAMLTNPKGIVSVPFGTATS